MLEQNLRLPKKDLLRHDVHGVLREAILSGRFQPGEKLPEDSLAAALAISRTPIREALHRLEVEGFVQALPRRGFVVARLSPHDLAEIYDIRLALEPYASERAIDRITLADLDTLEQNHHTSLQQLDAPDGATRYVQLNSEFHKIIYNATGNRRMAELIRQHMELALIYYGVALMSRESRYRLLTDHAAIIKVLREGNREAIGKLVRQHVLHGREALYAALEHAPTDGHRSGCRL